MTRPWNFSAGPATLPIEVLQQAASQMMDWHGSGVSVMEMSHRGKEFTQIRNEAEADLRTLLQVPDEFAVLFMQGGATAQNSILPLNLIGRNGSGKADYVLSGSWSEKSYKEAQNYGDMAIAASSGVSTTINGHGYNAWQWFPEPGTWQVRPDAAYVHVCSNETIGGVEFNNFPHMDQINAAGVPLVIDASSNFLSRPIDFSKADMVYAGAQKNAGPAGVTIVIIRRTLLGHTASVCPSVFNYGKVAAASSMLNTPPTYAIYIAGLLFKWLLKQGGVAAIEKINIAKANALYSYLDQTEFYINKVAKSYRSRMNVPFLLHNPDLDQAFLDQASEAGLVQLKGHKSVGGMRASIYNAMPEQGVHALISFMQGFERSHG